MADLPSHIHARCIGHISSVTSLQWTEDGKFVLSTSSDRTIRLWNPHKTPVDEEQRRILPIQTFDQQVHTKAVQTVAIRADNAQFVSGGDDKKLFIWDVALCRVVARYPGHDAGITQVHLQNEDILASGDEQGVVKLWDLRNRNNRSPIQLMDDAEASLTHVSFASDHLMVTSSLDGCVRGYDLRKGELFTQDVQSPVTSLAISNDRLCIAPTCLRTSDILLIELSTGDVLNAYSGSHLHTQHLLPVCFSSSDAHIVTGSENGHVVAYDIVTNEAATFPYQHTVRRGRSERQPMPVTALAGTKEPTPTIASGYQDGLILAWKV